MDPSLMEIVRSAAPSTKLSMMMKNKQDIYL